MTNESEPGKKVGRPCKLHPDDETLKALKGLGQIQATTKESAAFFNVSEPTFLKFLNDHETAREAFDEGKANGLVSLRRKQFQMAETNASMAIWLGKQYLGQKDKLEHEGGLGLTVNLKRYGADQSGR